ncbi:hypothetical protein [Umezawaea sp. Da 62-37]|nr:hypothetical protein [Umezawaea sp. Da 62-37]WNV85083.1 hypothetical protein RM788_44235 [Umezawaea sp. Da 62-37]
MLDQRLDQPVARAEHRGVIEVLVDPPPQPELQRASALTVAKTDHEY